MKKLLLMIILVSPFLGIKAQHFPLTVAEKSAYTSTAKYSEVIDYIGELLKISNKISIDNITVTAEGYNVPMLILADPLPADPGELADDDRLVVYIQANIHAGEVEGKEASLMLARDLLQNSDHNFFEHIILLIVPNVNPDGNEKISTENRTRQNGPVNGVGVRHNAQMLDLNRDAMKLETPEIKGVVGKILNRWDPAITVDCHTTNGSYHEEPVTFTWMMNPNGNRNLINYMRDRMMPAVHHNLSEKYNVENVYYGVFLDRLNIDTSWISYAAEPRYLVNYIGLRNRLAILNENYVYADYKTRVLGCYKFLFTIIEYASANKEEIKKLISDADNNSINRFSDPLSTDSFAIKYEGQPTPKPVTIKAIEADTIPGVKGYWRFKQSDRKRTVTVPYIADYYASETIEIPYAYLIEIPIKEVETKLIDHGIVVRKLKQSQILHVQQFNIESLTSKGRLNQGHYTNSIKGDYIEVTKEFKPGTTIIYTSQELGNLAAYLLEPQSDDGLLKWNFFDRYLVPQWGRNYYPYPVYRILSKNASEIIN